MGNIGYAIKIVARYMNENTIKILYHANVEAVMRYGIIFWGGNMKLNSVFIAQKRIIRTIGNMNYRESCRGKFKSLFMLTIYGLYIYECLLFVFKNKNEFIISGNHSYDTRNQDFIYPQHRLTLIEKGPYYMCIRIYNKLPIHLKNCDSLYRFKKMIKNMLVRLEPYSMCDYLNSRDLF